MATLDGEGKGQLAPSFETTLDMRFAANYERRNSLPALKPTTIQSIHQVAPGLEVRCSLFYALEIDPQRATDMFWIYEIHSIQKGNQGVN